MQQSAKPASDLLHGVTLRAKERDRPVLPPAADPVTTISPAPIDPNAHRNLLRQVATST
jgi:hypothetical protein